MEIIIEQFEFIKSNECFDDYEKGILYAGLMSFLEERYHIDILKGGFLVSTEFSGDKELELAVMDLYLKISKKSVQIG